jgi:hypothetical protein
VRNLLKAGAIDPRTAARELQRLRGEFVGSAAGARPGIAGWAEEGSAEAYSAIVRANQEDPKVELIEQTNKLLAKWFPQLERALRDPRTRMGEVVDVPPG